MQADFNRTGRIILPKSLEGKVFFITFANEFTKTNDIYEKTILPFLDDASSADGERGNRGD